MTRTAAERIADTRSRLDTEPNIWLATASAEGDPHCVPLSLAWLDDHVVVVTAMGSLTAQNLLERSDVRCHLDSSAQVVIIDGTAEVRALPDVDDDLVGRLVDRIGWDPRDSDNEWAFIVIEPYRVQAWSGPAEIEGRELMRDGEWVDNSHS